MTGIRIVCWAFFLGGLSLVVATFWAWGKLAHWPLDRIVGTLWPYWMVGGGLMLFGPLLLTTVKRALRPPPVPPGGGCDGVGCNGAAILHKGGC